MFYQSKFHQFLKSILLFIFLIFYSLLAQQVWNEDENGRPYWDMPIIDENAILKPLNPQDYVFNPFHQPNEIYNRFTCHGSGDGNNDGIVDILDKNLADASTDASALDINGDGIVNTSDGDIIQQYIDGIIAILPSWWNFLNKDEKLDWFKKLANIYSVDKKQYIIGDETTRYISGNFATELCIRMQGYNENNTDMLGGVRKPIPEKYEKDFNGDGNVPVYFVYISGPNGTHGMNWVLVGDNPLNFDDGVFYEPQTNQIVQPGDSGGSLPFNSTVHIYKLENFGGSSWGEDMPSRFVGYPQETMKILVFEIDSLGNSSLLGQNSNLLLTRPTVSIDNESTTSKRYLLGNNYPNPFNSVTNISFNVLRESQIILKVYDMNGKYIITLINNFFNKGNHSVSWNGKNGDNQPVSGGVYFYQIKAGDFTQTKKMILLR